MSCNVPSNNTRKKKSCQVLAVLWISHEQKHYTMCLQSATPTTPLLELKRVSNSNQSIESALTVIYFFSENFCQGNYFSWNFL
jgi:hypothetical protein